MKASELKVGQKVKAQKGRFGGTVEKIKTKKRNYKKHRPPADLTYTAIGGKL